MELPLKSIKVKMNEKKMLFDNVLLKMLHFCSFFILYKNLKITLTY